MVTIESKSDLEHIHTGLLMLLDYLEGCDNVANAEEVKQIDALLERITPHLSEETLSMMSEV